MLTHCGTQTIETQRLILRRFTYGDGEAMLKNWAGDQNIQSMYAEPVYQTAEEVKGLLDLYIAAYEKPDCYRWAVILKETGECIGQIAYFLINSQFRFGEIEYCIGGSFQKRGLATEATRAVIGYGFERIHLHRVQISHREDNPASRRVIEKSGFRFEGLLRDFFYMDDRYIGRLYYSLLKNEWENHMRVE